MVEKSVTWGEHLPGKPRRAHICTKEELISRYPLSNTSFVSKSTWAAVKNGCDIIYVENPNLAPSKSIDYDWRDDIDTSAMLLYKVPRHYLIIGPITEMLDNNAVYVAVKQRY